MSKLNTPVKIMSLSGCLSMLIAFGIIFVGIREFLLPGAGAGGYGVPLVDPADGDLLAIKAARDIASGIMVFAFLGLRDRKGLACAMAVYVTVAVLDGFIVFRHAGWIFRPVIWVHWGTAVYMLAVVALLRKGK
jgi:hypothetical protein